MVSIIIPCYNQSAFLQDAVDSILAQTNSNWECIIVNDCSTDQTQELANSLAKRDSRIEAYDTPQNSGLAGARNFGIERARGFYILPLDADDRVSPTYLEDALEEFRKNPETSLVYGKAEFFGEQKGEWHLPLYHYGLLFARNPIYCSAIFKKKDWEACGGYDSRLKQGLEDWDFWLRILSSTAMVVRLEKVCFYYRKHQQSMIADLVADKQLHEKAKADMLLRHREKWLAWSFDYLDPLLSQMQFYKERETQIGNHLLGRWLYRMARYFSKSS